MKQYSIGELEILTRIKAHTIRVWEQRYKLIVPDRSDGNTRYYNEVQLRLLMKIALLRKSGRKISEIAKLTPPQIEEETTKVSEGSISPKIALDQFMISSFNFNETEVSKLFHRYYNQYGVIETFEKIIFPFLRVVGNLWVSGKITPGHEHFFTNLCRQKLFSEIENLPINTQSTKQHILLCMPEWDFHELGILYYNYIFKKSGYLCTYMGQAVPASDVIYTTKSTKSDIIIINFIGPTSIKQINNYLNEIIKETKNTKIFISGPHVNKQIDTHKGRVTSYKGIHDLSKWFRLENDFKNKQE